MTEEAKLCLGEIYSMEYTQIKGKKILVTGGAGFIGSNLIASLVNEQNEVICLDNLCTGFLDNIKPFIGLPNFTFVQADICDLDACMQASKGVDIILHQAALGSVPRSINNPVDTVATNIGGFVNMLWAAVQNKVQRFVYAASSSTYGDHQALPKQEDIIGKPLSPYAVTKYANELFADNFSVVYGIETIGLRYFNVFGPKQDPNGAYAAVIPKFAQTMLEGKSPVINGDGTFSRDFTYIDNVVQANHLAAIVANPLAVNTVYNVAYGERTDLNQLFAYLREGLSAYQPSIAQLECIHGENRSGDIPHSHADISKARNLLGYNPQFSVRDGLIRTCSWYFEQSQCNPSTK